MNKNIFTYYLIVAMFLWGGGWSALKILTQNLDMEVIVFWRFFIMSISFVPILYFIKEPLTLNKQKIKFIASSSVLNIAFMVSSFFGIKYGLAGSGGVIITTLSPVITFLFVAILFKNKLKYFQYIGLFIGIVGGMIMLEVDSISTFLNSSNIYFLLCAIIWAGVTILSQHSHQHINPVHYSFFISIVATITTFLYAIGAHFNLSDVFSQNTEFWIAMIYLAVFGQSIATTIFFIASGKLGSQKTSSFMFLVPVFALFIASLLLHEPIQPHILLGGTLSLVAVYFINKKEK